MKRIAFIVVAAGSFAAVMAMGTLFGGWWGLSPYALMVAGALLILGPAGLIRRRGLTSCPAL